MGLLDMFNDPQSAGLLSAGASILERSGDTSRPFGLGQAMGTGINSYMHTNQAMRMRQLQEAQEKQEAERRALQIQQMQGEMQIKQQVLDRNDRIRSRLTGGGPAQPGQQVPAEYGFAGASHGAGAAPAQQHQASAAPQEGSRQGAIAYLTREAQVRTEEGDIDGASKALEHLAKLSPKFATEARTVMGPNRKPMLVQMADDGTVRPIQGGYGAAEKLHFGDDGQNLVGQDQYTGEVRSTRAKMQTRESIASERSAAAGRAVTMRGQNMGDARQREMAELTRQGQRTQIINDPMSGPLLIDKATGQARQAIGMDGQPIRGEQTIKKEKQAQGLVSVINSAEQLLDGATGSYAGAMADSTAQFFGKATPGAQNIAQLKVLEGSIMMNQPRMEGPQSDKDVALYRQMAGQIGDPTVPAALKKVALQSIKEINQRYAGGAPQQSAPQAAQPVRKSVLRGQVIDGYRFKGGDPSDQNNWELK